ncbi:putative ribosomal protein L13 [Helianthus annuus]|nr:putative ribosomal protein L13 [Helianthus annuus]KAJ0782572.1 putative ribosomal protein L13 [Helianthus annuus]KAJ0804053.1 putative ribosomal protein L13 [Helianthus annuus]
MRRDIAKLLETGLEATARIRVEHIIREEKMMAAQEIIELFCELVVVRLPIIEAQSWEALFTEAGPALEVLSDTLNAIDARQGYQIVYYTHLCSRNWFMLSVRLSTFFQLIDYLQRMVAGCLGMLQIVYWFCFHLVVIKSGPFACHPGICYTNLLSVFWCFGLLFPDMIPHKTKRGAAALARLKVYEGVPTPYNRKKRMVIPDALKVLRLTAGHKYCLLGRLSSEVGWNHYETIKELENKRKEKAQVVYERKKQLNKLRAKADKAAEEKLCSQLEILAPVTY